MFQNFGLPSVKHVYQSPESFGVKSDGPYEMSNSMLVDKKAPRAKLGLSHPLEQSEKNVRVNDLCIPKGTL